MRKGRRKTRGKWMRRGQVGEGGKRKGEEDK